MALVEWSAGLAADSVSIGIVSSAAAINVRKRIICRLQSPPRAPCSRLAPRESQRLRVDTVRWMTLGTFFHFLSIA